MQQIEDPLQHSTLDSILDKIGIGKAQVILSRSLILLLFSQGCQSIVLGLLLPQLSRDWELTTFQKSLLISAVYFGVTIGSYIQTFSDKYGRHIFVLLDAILQSVFGIISCVCVSYEQFLISRFFYGIGIGIVLPLSGAYLSEITPSHFRAKMLSISRVAWSLGCLFACFLGWMLMQGRHWRIILFIICLPGIYAIYDQWINGKQSIRYLWIKKENAKVKEVLDFMCEKNEVEKISIQLINELISKQQSQRAHQDNVKQGSFAEMLNEKYFFSTVYLLFAWFTVCFIYYGIMLLLPTILSNYTSFSNNFQYFFIFSISLVEIIAFYASSYFSDHEYFGRKKTIYYGMGIITISTIFVMLLSQTNYLELLIGYVVIKCFVTSTFMVLYPYTAQVYETKLRGTSMGYMSVIGRIGSIMIGMVGVSSLQWLDGNGLYLIFVLLSFFSTIFMFKMPYDTLGRALDQ